MRNIFQRIQKQESVQVGQYQALTNHTCFGHQMSVLVEAGGVGPQVNKFG